MGMLRMNLTPAEPSGASNPGGRRQPGRVQHLPQPDPAPDGVAHPADGPGVSRGFFGQKRAAVPGAFQGVGRGRPRQTRARDLPFHREPPALERDAPLRYGALVAVEEHRIGGDPGAEVLGGGFGVERPFGHDAHLVFHVRPSSTMFHGPITFLKPVAGQWRGFVEYGRPALWERLPAFLAKSTSAE